MTAALVTLVFLSTLWMLVVVGAAVLDGSSGKILAALRGRSFSPALATPPVRVRHQRYVAQRPRFSARQRVAA